MEKSIDRDYIVLLLTQDQMFPHHRKNLLILVCMAKEAQIIALRPVWHAYKHINSEKHLKKALLRELPCIGHAGE